MITRLLPFQLHRALVIAVFALTAISSGFLASSAQADDAVVALVRRQVVHVHQQKARRRHGQPGANTSLEAHASSREFPFSAVPWLET